MKDSPDKTPKLTLLFLFFILVFALLIFIRFAVKPDLGFLPDYIRNFLAQKTKTEANVRKSHLETNIYKTLKELEVKEDNISTHLFIEDTLREIEAPVPRGLPIEWIVWRLSQSVTGTPYKVADCLLDEKKMACTIIFESDREKNPKTVLTIKESDRFLTFTAKMAILIEGFDFQADQTTIDILSFPDPLTVSLLPYAKKSEWTAKAADEYNKEVIIQLPLESNMKTDLDFEGPVLMVHYPEEQIRRIIHDAVKVIPNFTGFNNLLGSRACEDSHVMGIILDEIKKRNGYFIETKTARNSVVPSVAKRISVPFTVVTHNIKKGSDVSDIEENLKHLGFVAQKRGSIVISAPASGSFIKALKNVHGFLKQNGIRLVYVSEAVNHPE